MPNDEQPAPPSEEAQADLFATELLAELGAAPLDYERVHGLIALAYLRGGQAALIWAVARIDRVVPG